jgi:hypothetical protein
MHRASRDSGPCRTDTCTNNARITGLTPSEVPQNITLRESRGKNSTDASKFARDLRWQQEYVVRFTIPLEEVPGQTEFLQTVILYPAKNITAIAALEKKQERSDKNMIFF